MVSGGLAFAAARRVARQEDYERNVPLMGVLGAFVFAAQMINFSIPGMGSSGHIGGGMLLAILLGPSAAFLVIASVLTVQCLFFADGGLLALGCNIFNLGFWPAFVGLPAYRLIAGKGANRGRLTVASIVSVVAALELGALGVVVETSLSGRSELPVGPFALIMMRIHLPIAVVEGFITAGVVLLVRRFLPNDARRTLRAEFPVLAMLAALTLLAGGVFAWFASARPDGLEWSIGRVFGGEELPAWSNDIAAKLEKAQSTTALLPDYNFPAGENVGAANESEPWPAVNLGTSVAGVVRAVVTVLVVFLIGFVLRRLGRGRTAVLLCGMVLGMVVPPYVGRPLTVDDAGTAEEGRLEIELGVGYERDSDTHHMNMPVVVTYGVIKDVEAGLGFDCQLEQRGWGAGDSECVGDWSDLSLAAKWNPVAQEPAGVSLALAGAVKIPVADDDRGLGSRRTDYDLTLIGSRSWRGLSAHVNVGHTWIGGDSDECHYGVGADYSLRESLAVMAEVFFATPREGGREGQ